MSSNYEIINLKRGTDEWLNWRHRGIGKIDAADIMGVGLSIPGTLLPVKRRDNPPRILSTPEQDEGIALEPEARRSFEKKFGQSMPAACIQSTSYNWMKASLDGLSEDRCSVLEITCGKKTYSKTDSGGQPPKYIRPQLQHILAITGLNSIDFYCYRPSRPPILRTIARDNEYIDELIAKEEKFWQDICKGRNTSSDYIDENDFMRPKVYVLELEGGYYYVGMCKNFPDRIKRHIEGNGSLWTKLHRPIASLAFFWGDEETEKSVTLHYMEKYGLSKVRGWVFAKGGEYADEKQVRYHINKASAAIPFDHLDVCTSLSPMKLPRNSAWEKNSKNLDAGSITREETLY